MNCVKKIITAAFLIACLSLSLMACGNNNNTNSNNNGGTNTTVQNPVSSPSQPVSQAPVSQAPVVPDESTSGNSSNDSNNYDSLNQTYNLDFTLINQMGVDIYAIYVSPTGEGSWGSNILTVPYLSTSCTLDIYFSPTESFRYWDLMIEDYNGNTIEWYSFDLASISEITLYFNGDTPTADYR